jgi:hypothetical protein
MMRSTRSTMERGGQEYNTPRRRRRQGGEEGVTAPRFADNTKLCRYLRRAYEDIMHVSLVLK